MADSTMRQEMESSVNRCRIFLAGTGAAPYLDGIYEILPADVPIRENERDEDTLLSYESLAEGLLLQNPSDLAVRFAVLYPLSEAALAYSSRLFHPSSQAKATFQRLVLRCIPERLTDLRDLKFELHNTYLAGQWDQGAEILRRIAMIGAMGAAEIAALRGHYMFLSVWGRRIEWDLEQQGDSSESHECFWPNTVTWLPPEFDTDAKRKRSELRSFARPELIELGSVAHWTLTAWSTNPRSPKLISIWPELDFSTPEVPPLERDDQDETASVRKYVQDLYRDFQPITQPSLDEAGGERLHHACQYLEDAATMSPGLGSIYRPILARALFCLGKFELAAREYEKLYEQNMAFYHRIELVAGGYQEEKEDYQWEISFMTALCDKLAGDFDHAILVLERLQSSEHRAVGAAWWAARWYTERGQYDKAAELLEKELKLRFSPPDSWELSAILALAKVAESQQDAQEFVKRLARSNPEAPLILLGMSAQFWPNITKLSSESRDHWLYAEVQLHSLAPIHGAEGIAATSAIREFGWILELELKTCVFDEFRNVTSGDADRLVQARADSRDFWRDKFLKYIVGRDGELSLGSMIGAFNDCRNSMVPTHLEFRGFVEARFPRLLSAVADIETVNDHRDCASHPNQVFDKATALTVANACRAALDALRPSQ